jgi:hypothetical protein
VVKSSYNYAKKRKKLLFKMTADGLEGQTSIPSSSVLTFLITLTSTTVVSHPAASAVDTERSFPEEKKAGCIKFHLQAPIRLQGVVPALSASLRFIFYPFWCSDEQMLACHVVFWVVMLRCPPSRWRQQGTPKG